MITIKVNENLKNMLIEEAKKEDKNLSQYVRTIINNKLTDDNISNNQSHLSDIINPIIDNVFDSKFYEVYKYLKEIYFKQEFLIYLNRNKNNEEYQKQLKDFTISYEDDLRKMS